MKDKNNDKLNDLIKKHKEDLKKKLETPSYYLFKTAGEKFRLINDNTKSIIVNYGDAESLVDQVKKKGFTYELMNALGQYTVNVSKSNYELLKGAFDKGERVPEGLFFLMNKSQYDKQTGVILKNKYIEDVYTK